MNFYFDGLQCFPQPYTLFVAALPRPHIYIYMQIHFLPAGGALRAGEIQDSPVTLSSQTLPYQALHAKWNENEIENFLNTVGFLLKYSDIKTPASVFDFETCSAHVYSMKSKPFGKSICGRQFWYCNKSMCGKPWVAVNTFKLTLVLLKWNGEMLVKWLRTVLVMLFMHLSPHWDADAEITASVTRFSL